MQITWESIWFYTRFVVGWSRVNKKTGALKANHLKMRLAHRWTHIMHMKLYPHTDNHLLHNKDSYIHFQRDPSTTLRWIQKGVKNGRPWECLRIRRENDSSFERVSWETLSCYKPSSRGSYTALTVRGILRYLIRSRRPDKAEAKYNHFAKSYRFRPIKYRQSFLGLGGHCKVWATPLKVRLVKVTTIQESSQVNGIGCDWTKSSYWYSQGYIHAKPPQRFVPTSSTGRSPYHYL